jgi:hypothetical protein
MRRLEALVTTTCPPKVPGEERKRFADRCAALEERAKEYSSLAKQPEISRAFAALREVLPLPQTRPNNRVLAPEFEAFIWSIVDFYRSCGGNPSKRPNSPCDRFVRAAAEETLREAGWELRRDTVATFIRRALRHWALATSGFAVTPPDIGAPSLNIIKKS